MKQSLSKTFATVSYSLLLSLPALCSAIDGWTEKYQQFESMKEAEGLKMITLCLYALVIKKT